MEWTVKGIEWRNLGRGLGWLLVAAIGLLLIDHLEWTGISPYSTRKLGALFTIAASVFGGYRVSRDVLRIDPGSLGHPQATAIAHLARSVLMAGFAIAACVSV